MQHLPTDNWLITAYNDNDEVLGVFPALFYSETTELVRLDAKSGVYSNSGRIKQAKVEKNGVHVATIKEPYDTWYVATITGQVQPPHYVDIYKHEFLSDLAVPVKKCTCGGWAVYGRDADIHSDDISNRCELREP